MRVYVVESLKLEPRRVLDVCLSTQAARAIHKADDWQSNEFDEWKSRSLNMQMTPHEVKG